MTSFIVQDVIQEVSIQVPDERLAVIFNLQGPLQRLESILSLASLGLRLRGNAINELQNRARGTSASDKDSHELA